MNLASDERSGVDDQHHLPAVNSATKNADGQPRHSKIAPDKGVAGDEENGTVIPPGDEAVHKLPVTAAKLADLSADASTAAC